MKPGLNGQKKIAFYLAKNTFHQSPVNNWQNNPTSRDFIDLHKLQKCN